MTTIFKLRHHPVESCNRVAKYVDLVARAFRWLFSQRQYNANRLYYKNHTRVHHPQERVFSVQDRQFRHSDLKLLRIMCIELLWFRVDVEYSWFA
jgi:hypothetical protein